MKVIRWAALFSVILFIILLSTRQLSDPDLGFHLKYGRYIVEQGHIPATDQSTYTVTGHRYIDLHWLFQLLVYGVYHVSGYEGLSVLLIFCSLLLFVIQMARFRHFSISMMGLVILIFLFFLIIEARIILRPEIFSFIFLSLLLLIMERYYHSGEIRLLKILPFIMLAWIQMHSLYILGLIVLFFFFVSLWKRDKKPDRKLLAWMLLSGVACLANPYFLDGILFPLGLLSRFNSTNIFHQHIAEFKSFFSIDQHSGFEYLFLITLFITVLSYILTFRRRHLHEWLLLVFSAYLSLVVVRNIPFFAIMNLSGLGRSLTELWKLSPVSLKNNSHQNGVKATLYIIIILSAIIGIFRIRNAAFYISDHTNNRFGIGLHTSQFPEKAADFILDHQLDARVLNSLGTGGWLSWRIPQPVFIDGRLEVMNEALYLELMESWNGSLNCLLEKYKPGLVVYNYLKYYPWTHQLYQNPDWRLIYLDGLFAIWAENHYAIEIPALSSSDMRASVKLSGKTMLQPDVSSTNKVKDWLLRGRDDVTDSYRNMGMFLLQGNDQKLAEDLLKEVMIRTRGRDEIAAKALSEIKMQPHAITPGDRLPEKGENLNKGAAKQFFNRGNDLYSQKDLQGAIVSYSQAIRLDPGYCKAYNNRGNILALLGKYELAIKDFDSALILDPAFADAYLGRGSCRYSLGKPEKAKEDWIQADRLGHPKAGQMLQLLSN